MKNFIQTGEKVTLTATASVVSGEFVVVGKFYGVVSNDAAIGEDYVLNMGGVYELTKNAPEVWTAGDQLYWDSTTKEVTTVVGTNQMIGVAFKDALSADVLGQVRLNSDFV